MADGGIGEMSLADMALSGAAVGGVGAALTGKNPLTGALLGGALGGIGGLAGQGAAVAADSAPAVGTNLFADQMPASMAMAPTADAVTQQGVLNAISPGSTIQSYAPPSASDFASQGVGNAAATSVGGTAAQNAPSMVGSSANAPDNIDIGGGYNPASGSSIAPQSASTMDDIINWAKKHPMQAAGMGLGAYLLGPGSKPNLLPGYTPPSAASYGLGRTLAAGYQPVRPMAGGGITSLNVGPGSVPTQGVAPSDLMQKPNQGAGLDSLAAQYGISPQMVSQARQTYGFSAGGPTEMAVGGKLLSGHGDGMSDSIKANISGNQEARLANSEFVVPADVVSHLGNGSTDAGAKQLYSMMDRVRKARTGRKAQGRQINPQQYMPA